MIGSFDSQNSEHSCKSCGNSFRGLYCNLCGEKLLLPEEKSLRFFLFSVVNALTFFESKFFLTIKTIVINPGKVALDFSNGKRAVYVKLVSLFFFLNIVYFLLPLSNVYNTSITNQLHYQPYGSYIIPVVENYMAAHAISETDFIAKYDVHSTNVAKLFVIVIVLINSLFFSLLYFKRKLFFYDHVTFSLEFNCYNFLINIILLQYLTTGLIVLLAKFGKDISYIEHDDYTMYFLLTSLAYFFIRAGIRFYNHKPWLAVLKTVVVIFTIQASLFIYRFFLFFLTLWTLDI